MTVSWQRLVTLDCGCRAERTVPLETSEENPQDESIHVVIVEACEQPGHMERVGKSMRVPRRSVKRSGS